jgi:poly(3-hydroxybutyrate) depolymerase
MEVMGVERMKSSSWVLGAAVVLAGCLPSGKGASRCGGYLGCSNGQVVEPPDGGGVGVAPTPLPPPPVSGCGKPLPADQPATVPGTPSGYMHYTVIGTGASLAGPQPAKMGPRTFWVRVPADYDPNKPYRVVYLAQGCGGYEVANTSTYRLYDESLGGDEEALYVALDIPRDMANMDCYDTFGSGTASQEWEAFQLFHSLVDQTYCVDNDRVDVVGYDFGGDLSNMWGCYFGGDGIKPASDPAHHRAFAPYYHIRAQGAVASLEPMNGPPCNGPVAAFVIHDMGDGTAYSDGLASRDRALRMNGCTGSPTEPYHADVLGPDICLKYTACPAAYPVVFCSTMGLGHSDQHDRLIPGVTLFFKELEQAPIPKP